MSAHRWQERGLRAGAILWLACLVPAAAAAQAGSAATIVAQGNGHGAPACISCHGPQLAGNPVGGIPRIAGLSAEYIQAQLDALASGARRNAIMLPVASSLSAAERQALAAYISTLRVPAPVAAAPDSAPPPATPAQMKLGARLASRGDWSRQLPGCDQCHGPGGVGVGSAFPPLAGQSALYLTTQLDAWKQGTRPGGPLDLMAALVKRMTDADIAAVAAYYAAQPPTPAAAGRSRP